VFLDSVDGNCRFDVPYDCSVELSPLGYQFFTDLFETFDKVPSVSRYNWAAANVSTSGSRRGAENGRVRPSFQHFSRESLGNAKVPRHHPFR
jgi:hypothetical protein